MHKDKYTHSCKKFHSLTTISFSQFFFVFVLKEYIHVSIIYKKKIFFFLEKALLEGEKAVYTTASRCEKYILFRNDV